MTKLTQTVKLQKSAAGKSVWAEIAGHCTGPVSLFRRALRDLIDLNRDVRMHDDAAGRRADKDAIKAEAALKAIEGLGDDHVGYGIKFPRTPWEECEARFLTLGAMAAHIESTYAPGCTSEPYVQLIEITQAGKSVVAEYASGDWLDPLVAAGFASGARLHPPTQ